MSEMENWERSLSENRGPSVCLSCGELLQEYGDGYGHLRGWCKEGK